jgi:hypothetical protein
VLNAKYAQAVVTSTAGITADAIITALSKFQECVRYLNTRRSTGAVLNLDSEAAVQDALFLMLRPWISDLLCENPTGRTANRYSIKDFLIPQANTVVEVKFVRDASHGKQISREMHDDIENYRHHPNCSTLVFFVYDPDSLVPDQEQLRIQIEEIRTYGGEAKPLRCVLLVRP